MKDWDTVYEYLTGHAFSKKPAMEGAGGAAGEVYAWAIENPDKVSCVYAGNPRMHSALAKTQPLDNLAPSQSQRTVSSRLRQPRPMVQGQYARG